MTEDETWDRARKNMISVLSALGDESPDKIEISLDALVSAHFRIFGDLFADDAGRLRWKHSGEWETGPFGVGVGSGPSVVGRPFVGTSPKGIRKALTKEFVRFGEAVAELSTAGSPKVLDACSAAGRLYARILRIHPFVDGNLRAAFVILQAALLRLNLPAIEFRHSQDEHDRALLAAFQPGGRRQSYQPMAKLIESKIPKNIQG